MWQIGYVTKNVQGNRIYDTNHAAATISSQTGGLGGKGVSLIIDDGLENEKQTKVGDYLTTLTKDFKYISLFAGIGGFDFGLNAVGGECVFASEIDKFASESYKTLHNGDVLHGDITKINAEDVPDHDVIAAGFPCFVAGTLVRTDKGLVPIENVTSKHNVLTHNNRFRKVVTPMKKDVSALLSIKILGAPEFRVTDEHPYYAVLGTDVWNANLKRYVRQYSEPTWVDAKDLIPGKHYVAYAHYDQDSNPYNITEEEAYLIGRYIADGYLNTSKRKDRKSSYNAKVVLCIGKEKVDDFYENIQDYYFGRYEDKSVFKCTANSNRLVELCELSGRGAENKEFSETLLRLPKPLLKRVIDGYMAGDGYTRKNVFYATTVSKKLTVSLATAIRKVFGVQATITYTKRPKTTIIEGRTVNQRDTYRVAFRIDNVQSPMSVTIDDTVFSPVRKMNRIYEDVTVYNIEVEDDNSYTADGCSVHNCQAFSVAGKRGGFDDARGTLFFEVARIAAEKKPKVVLLENVKGLVGHDKGRTLDTIVQTLNEIGYRVDFDVLNSKYFGVPQNRERIFIVAVREDLIENEAWNIKGTNVVAKGKKRISGYEDVKTFNFSYPTNDTVELRLIDVLETNVDEKYYLSEEKTSKLVAQLDDKVAIKPEGVNKVAGLYGKSQAGSVYDPSGVSATLDTAAGGYREPIITETTTTQQGVTMNRNEINSTTDVANTLQAGEVNQGVVIVEGAADRTRNGEKTIEPNGQEVSNALTSVQHDSLALEKPSIRIRKLTPKECWRLQGFTDEQHDAVESAGISNSQRYKQAGNAVTVNVIKALGERLLPFL